MKTKKLNISNFKEIGYATPLNSNEAKRVIGGNASVVILVAIAVLEVGALIAIAVGEGRISKTEKGWVDG